MSDNHDGCVDSPVKLLKALQQSGSLGIQCAGRLIRQNQAGICDDRAGRRNPLLLTARYLMRIFFQNIGDIQQRSGLPNPLLDLAGRGLFIVSASAIFSNGVRVSKTSTGKTDKILAFHGLQSFNPGEVTPEQAHKIGFELAQKLWGERFQVLVCTHTDQEHIHNHFVLNSVPFLDGKKYNDCDRSYRITELYQALSKKIAFAALDTGKPFDRGQLDFQASCISFMLCQENGVNTDHFKFKKMPEVFKTGTEKEIRDFLKPMRDTYEDTKKRMEPNRGAKRRSHEAR